MKKILLRLQLVAALLLLWGASSSAQTIGYAEAIDRLAVSCGKDIDRFCRNANLGGGRIQQCLEQNQNGVSAQCKATVADVTSLLAKRAAARDLVPKVCEFDIMRLCSGVVPGDGNLLACFMKTEQNASAPCRQAVINAGYR